ncbi:NUDIX domain-containing protein [Pseudomonas veronii]|nr:NUDIX domain-containing protein [Pseudomonas veronii]
MGGLVASAEIVAQTLERETQEEAGLSIDTLLGVEACGSFTVHRSPFTVRRSVEDAGSHGFMVETLHVVRCVVPATAIPFNQDGEVSRFGLFLPIFR